MALLKYIGNSRYGTTLTLSDLKTIITITPNKPYEINIDNDVDRRYYNSLLANDIVLLEDKVSELAEVKEEEVKESEKVEVDSHEPTKEEVHAKLMELSDEEISDLLEKNGIKTRKKNKDSIVWDLISKSNYLELI